MAKKQKKLSIFEIVWYSLTGLVGLWGLTYIVLGLVAGGLRITSALRQADAELASLFKYGFLIWGIIILAIAVFAAIIVLLICAAKADRVYEKEQKRAARLANITAAVSEEKAPEVIDAE
jgi:TM2 domain-containing membrane protein YozV